MAHEKLAGKSILVAEDDILIGLMLKQEIESAGGRALGPARSGIEALALLESEHIDVAVLDVKLADGSVSDVAEALDQAGVPFVVTSGYERERLPRQLRNAPYLPKPVATSLIIDAIAKLADARLSS